MSNQMVWLLVLIVIVILLRTIELKHRRQKEKFRQEVREKYLTMHAELEEIKKRRAKEEASKPQE